MIGTSDGGAPAFREVTKDQFKEIYFRLGGGPQSGWTADYWQKFFEEAAKPGSRFLIQEPTSPEHDRMCIVADGQEYRLFFLTEESLENLFDYPGKE
jgi:hypothetical protein